MTFPSGPLASSAQLLAQSHIYTLQTHTHTHTLTHTAFISLSRSVFCLHTHTCSRLHEQRSICEEKPAPAYAERLIKRPRIFKSSYRSETLALYYSTQCHLHKTVHSYDQRDLPPLQGGLLAFRSTCSSTVSPLYPAIRLDHTASPFCLNSICSV